MKINSITDLNLKNKNVLIREDFNVPIENGKITSETRIKAALPTIEYCLKAGAKVILMSHLGRPTEGKFEPELSLKPVAESLSNFLGKPVPLAANLENIQFNSSNIVLLENVRFLKGEKNNDANLAKKMAALCDVFVMDAFATAHRAEASTFGVAEYAPIACAGFLLMGELTALQKALEKPKRPLVAIIGGSKVSTKLTVLKSLLEKVDQLIVGGGIANTFLAAKGYAIGKSLYEPDLLDEAKQLLQLAEKTHKEILLPKDVVTATEFSATAKPSLKSVSAVKADELILDIGPETANIYAKALQQAGTILWNGPVGVFEIPAFAEGTKALALAIAESPAFSIAGGGDTLAAIEKFAIADKISYISTGGGAFLEFVEGKELPALKILAARSQS